MPDMTIQRWDNQTATDDMYPADVWIEDTKMALDDVVSQCKEWWNDPKLADWCRSVRSDAWAAIKALEQLQTSIKQQPTASR